MLWTLLFSNKFASCDILCWEFLHNANYTAWFTVWICKIKSPLSLYFLKIWKFVLLFKNDLQWSFLHDNSCACLLLFPRLKGPITRPKVRDAFVLIAKPHSRKVIPINISYEVYDNTLQQKSKVWYYFYF